jgi:hypothetical protein
LKGANLDDFISIPSAVQDRSNYFFVTSEPITAMRFCLGIWFRSEVLNSVEGWALSTYFKTSLPGTSFDQRFQKTLFLASLLQDSPEKLVDFHRSALQCLDCGPN